MSCSWFSSHLILLPFYANYTFFPKVVLARLFRNLINNLLKPSSIRNLCKLGLRASQWAVSHGKQNQSGVEFQAKGQMLVVSFSLGGRHLLVNTIWVTYYKISSSLLALVMVFLIFRTQDEIYRAIYRYFALLITKSTDK